MAYFVDLSETGFCEAPRRFPHEVEGRRRGVDVLQKASCEGGCGHVDVGGGEGLGVWDS